MAVADGIGGYAGGEVASALLLSHARNVLQEIPSKGYSLEMLKPLLRRIVTQTQELIAKEKEAKPALHGMGTTLACAFIVEDKYVIGNIGDSRVYLLRGEKARRLTEDHSYIGQLSSESEAMMDSALLEKYSHIVTRSVDGGGDQVDIFPKEEPFFLLQNGDILVLCTDGLIADKSKNWDAPFARFLRGTSSLKGAVEQMISHAFYDGSGDNITVVLGAYGDVRRGGFDLKALPYPPFEHLASNQSAESLEKQRRNRLGGRYTIAGLVLAIVAMLLAVVIQRDSFNDASETAHKLAQINKMRSIPPDSQRLFPREIASSAETPNQKPVDWDPFQGKSEKPYSISHESFQWTEHTGDPLERYEVTFGSTGPFSVKENWIPLQGKGLQRGIVSVRIVAILINGNRPERTGKIELTD